jgi:hypothetical protein
MKTKTRDLAALGAQLMPTRDLLALAGVHPEEASDAEHALSLHCAAREIALRPLRCGPRLVAAIELGRRAWMLPSPAGRRVRAPVDVAAVCAPRFAGTEHDAMAIALDRRMTIARVACAPVDAVGVPRFTLAAGVTRVVVAISQRRRSAFLARCRAGCRDPHPATSRGPGASAERQRPEVSRRLLRRGTSAPWAS